MDTKINSKIPFKIKVLAVVSKIPRGKTLTYMEVAELAGSPGAFRAVGTIMKNNHNSKIPCHRVIHSDGRIGQYNRGNQKKIQLLKKEGAIPK
jgi:O-6-methylguanine DNA methyltransferase